MSVHKGYSAIRNKEVILKRRWAMGLAVLIGLTCSVAAFSEQGERAKDRKDATVSQQQIERGRYLVKIMGCNDCHTAGYAESGGKTPEQQWLLGNGLGFRGPWGTTYPSNLRRSINNVTETQWIDRAKKLETRPPMPWFSVRALNEADLRAIYHFVKSLGQAGEAAPEFVPSDKEPPPPFIQWPMPPK